MAHKELTINLILPFCWSSYLTYGFTDALQDGEADAIDAFMQKNNIGALLNVDSHTYFSWHNDYDNIGSDVCSYTFVRKRKK